LNIDDRFIYAIFTLILPQKSENFINQKYQFAKLGQNSYAQLSQILRSSPSRKLKQGYVAGLCQIIRLITSFREDINPNCVTSISTKWRLPNQF